MMISGAAVFQRRVNAVFALIAVLLSSSAWAVDHGKPSALVSGADFAKDRILVKVKPETTAAAFPTLGRTQGAQTLRRFQSVPGLHLLKLPPGLAVKDAIEQLRNDPRVAFAEPDYRVFPQDTLPVDSEFNNQWGLHDPLNDLDINAPLAWDITTGSEEVVIGVIDTGVNFDHGDLRDNIWTNPQEVAGDLIDNDNNGYLNDIHGINTLNPSSPPLDASDIGHGTHIAGIIGAMSQSPFGIAGVNWRVKILPCKALNIANGTEFGAVSNVIECLDYFLALKQRGVNIIATNNSWGRTGPPHLGMIEAIRKHMDAGILFVAAAGNDGLDLDYGSAFPAGYSLPNVIAVTGHDASGQIGAGFNTGARSVHIAAPGVNIFSTVQNGFGSLSGTSMAAPFVTGVAGLLKAQQPNLAWFELRNLMLSGGADHNALTPETISGKRLRAADGNGAGVLTCRDQSLLKRLYPKTDTVFRRIGSGQTIVLAMLHINCNYPAGAPDVTVAETGETITLTDDGTGFDEFPGDGIYTAAIDENINSGNPALLQFPDGSGVDLQVDHYYMMDIPQTPQWRTGTVNGSAPLANSADLSDNGYHLVSLPFDLNHGGNVYTQVAVFDNGFVMLKNPVDSVADSLRRLTNHPLPNPYAETIIAPLWMDLKPAMGTPQNVFYEIVGNNQLIVQWHNLSANEQDLGDISFQLVLTDTGDEIVFNYRGVSNQTTTANQTQSAYIGMQSLPKVHSLGFTPLFETDHTIRWSRFDGATNYPPTISPLIDNAFVAGDNVTFTMLAFDPNGTTPMVNITNLPTGATSNAGVFVFNNAVEGSYTLQVTATDAADAGIATEVPVTFDVVANAPPAFIPDSNVTFTGAANTRINFLVKAKDPNHTPVSISMDTLPVELANAGITFNTQTGQFTWPNAEPEGNYAVTFTAQDSVDSNLTARFTANIIIEANQPPVIDPVDDITVTEGEPVELTITVTDPENAPVTLSLANAPADASFNPDTGVFTWPEASVTPQTAYPITITATDSLDTVLTDSQTFTITVIPNTAPTFDAQDVYAFQRGERVDLTFIAEDSNNLSVDTFSLPEGLPVGAQFRKDIGTLTLSWNTGNVPVGTYNITIQVTDALDPTLTVTRTISLEIRDNIPPVLQKMNDITVMSGAEIRFTLEGDDGSGGQPLFLIAGKPSSATFNGETGEFYWERAVEGTYDVTFMAQDAFLSDLQDEFTLTINVQPNARPVIQPVSVQLIHVGETLNLTLEVSDEDQTEVEVTVVNLPEGATFDPDTLTIHWPDVSTTGRYDIDVVAKDGVDPTLLANEDVIIVVQNASTGDSSSGGGGLGPVWLLTVLVVILFRRKCPV